MLEPSHGGRHMFDPCIAHQKNSIQLSTYCNRGVYLCPKLPAHG